MNASINSLVHTLCFDTNGNSNFGDAFNDDVDTNHAPIWRYYLVTRFSDFYYWISSVSKEKRITWPHGEQTQHRICFVHENNKNNYQRV